MRRTLMSAVLTVAVALAVPGAAAAKHHTRHHKRTHHTRVHLRRLGDMATTPTTKAPAAPAGTIASFSGGVLTLTLADGSTVKGTVTSSTEIECASGATGTGDDDATEGTETEGTETEHSVRLDGDGGSSSADDQGDDQGDDNGSTCGANPLSAGVTVLGAELRIGPSGSTFSKIELG